MTKISKEKDYDTWYMRNYARGISTFFISIWVLNKGINEGMVLGAFLLVMLVSVIIAWWREGIGGLMLTITGLAAIVVVTLTMPLREYWVTQFIGAPFLISGILYLKCWRRIKSKTPQDIPNKESDATSYCPKCKAQYREGFFKCSDCGVQLEKFKRISH